MTRFLLSLKIRLAGSALVFVAAGAVAHAQLAKKVVDLPNDPAWIKKTAAEIDKRIGQDFTKSKVTPAPAADDSRWLRRVYLDAIGRIPSYDEAKAFLDDTSPEKRAKLIDKLLNSEGYVSTTYNWMCDILRATSKLGVDNTRSGVPYLRWIRESVATNKPWDKMVYELLTTNGGGWEPGKGAVGYFERDRGMPLDNMANTTRIFLGTHIECAQCHDHPYDKWKQKDFYEMSAFTHGMVTGSNSEQKKYVNEKYNGKTGLDPDKSKREVYRWLMDNIYDFSVYGDGKGNIVLPMDFKGKGARGGETVPAKSIYPGARGGTSRDMKDAREKFAAWMTEPENPRFTMILVNRLWKRDMGIGLFEPVDKFVEPTKDNPTGTLVSNPAVLEYLQQVMKELNYDIKGMHKVLLNTRVYALGTNRDAVDPRSKYSFQGRAVKRMTAEQVWDSMATLVIPDLDYRKGNSLDHTAVVAGRNLGKSIYDVYKEVIGMKPAEISAWVDKVISSNAAKGASGNTMTMDKSMMASNDAAAASMTDGAKWNGMNAALLRASELPSPTPPQHFLRKFGQSSREVIEGGSSESDVTQVLSLINGHVEKNIVNDSRAVVYKAIDAADSPEGKIKAAFLAILTRYPTPAETDLMLPEAKKGREGIKNIIYALLNSNEFMFIL